MIVSKHIDRCRREFMYQRSLFIQRWDNEMMITFPQRKSVALITPPVDDIITATYSYATIDRSIVHCGLISPEKTSCCLSTTT